MAGTPRASSSAVGGWLSGALLKDAALTDEELAARDLTRADPEVQKRFGKGTRYDLKCLVRGDIGTGKSALLKRLRGGGFTPAYEPSVQISTAKIAWKCASEPDDVITLEVWDVVDRARKVATTGQLALGHRTREADARPEDGKHALMPLDATVLDVYTGAHAVIFMVDPSKPWTVDYVTRELAKCPEHLPVAVLVNFRDYGPDRRGVTAASLDAVLCAPPFTSRTFRPQALEASMANCFGLHALHSFLAVPFLAHKRVELSRALDSNTAAMGAAHKALAEMRSTMYEDFVARLEATARAEAAAADMARLAAAEAAAAAERAEAERWSWLTGDTLAQPPGPGGAPGGPPRAAAVPVVQPGGGVFAVVPQGALLPSRPLPAAAAAPPAGVAGSMLSYLGGLGSTLGAASSYLGSLVGAPPPPKTATAQLDDFLGAPAPGAAAGSDVHADFLGGEEAGGGAAVPRGAPPPRRGSRARHPGMKQHDWDSDDDSEDDRGPGLGARTSQVPAIPSMRPSTTVEKPLVLGQGPPSSPGSSRNSTPHSTGGGALRTGGFGPPPGAFAPAYDADAYGAPQQRSSQHASRSGSPPGGGRRASAVSLGGARRSKHADGRAREWDESSSSDGDD